MKHIGILGVGKYLPKKIVTNQDLEKIVDTTDEWIYTRTGIKERRIADDSETTSNMAFYSAQEALKNAGKEADEIDLIIVASATPDHRFPSVACMVQEKLQSKAVAYDVSAACSGFMFAMITAQQFIQNGVYKNALIIGAEKLSNIMDWDDRTTCVLFGDGAGAVVLGEVSEGKGILSFELGSDGKGGKHLYDDEVIKMNGREVFKFAVRQMGESAIRVVEKANLEKTDIDYLIPHQANIRIMESAREKLGLPIERMSKTVDRYGNTSAASIPLSLCYDLENGKIKDGDIVVMVGFGGGLTWGAVTLRWGK